MSSDKEKINARLFDLVRYMRSELHAANLITDEEYSWLCHGCHLAKGGGSPSPRRLEDYDALRAKVNELEQQLHALRLVCGTTDANKFQTVVDRQLAKIAELEQDKARLDWLDGVNHATNEYYETNYGWRYEINHNRSSLTDHWFPALTIRQAIDAARSKERT